jgi:hypothetical protein
MGNFLSGQESQFQEVVVVKPLLKLQTARSRSTRRGRSLGVAAASQSAHHPRLRERISARHGLAPPALRATQAPDRAARV